ncbi:hypothetical protein ACLB9X_03645 [Streptomyces sp. 5K101]|uniref:hypothetical protein n=1 Tax=Streptomyces sp. 5K101 TaxID=3390037 RepID=UPI003975368C
MNARTRPSRTALAAVAAAAAVAGLAAASVPAAAAHSAAPRFLAPKELPPHPTSAWYAGPVTSGQPDPLPMCVGEALPPISQHRQYWTEFDTGALQVTVVERSVTRAKQLAALWQKKLSECAAELMEKDPEVTATARDYGRIDVEEGARVYGIHTRHTWGASDISLFSVGRDDRTVTFVRWAQMGTFEHAQVADFKRTTATAVNKLH